MSLLEIVERIQNSDALMIQELINQIPYVQVLEDEVNYTDDEPNPEEVEKLVSQLLDLLGNKIDWKLRKKLELEAKIWKEHKKEKERFIELMKKVTESRYNTLLNKLNYSLFISIVERFYNILGDFLFLPEIEYTGNRYWDEDLFKEEERRYKRYKINFPEAAEELISILKAMGVSSFRIENIREDIELDRPFYVKKKFRVFYRTFLELPLSKAGVKDFVGAKFLGENVFKIPVNEDNFPQSVVLALMQHAINIPINFISFVPSYEIKVSDYDSSTYEDELIVDYEVKNLPRVAKISDVVVLFEKDIRYWETKVGRTVYGIGGNAHNDFAVFAMEYGLFIPRTNTPTDDIRGSVLSFEFGGIKEIFEEDEEEGENEEEYLEFEDDDEKCKEGEEDEDCLDLEFDFK